MLTWGELVGLAIAASGPTLTLVTILHTRRSERFKKLEASIAKLDTDFDGLTTQLAENALDTERRFVSRSDHTESINRLELTMGRLATAVEQNNQRLFDVARERGA